MYIVLAQQNYHIGNFQLNTAKIVAAVKAAAEEGADLIVFSELAVCGYPPRDFLEFDEFIQKCTAAIEFIAEHTENIAVLVGGPSVNPRIEGKDLHNTAFFLYQKEIKQMVHKALLPNYDVFDEYRYFEPGYEFHCVEFKGLKLAVTICEDIWDMEDNPLYRMKPMDFLIKENPDLMINLSASPFDYTHAADRKYILQKNALHYCLPIIYVNTVGSQTEIVFDGGSMACDAAGNLLLEMPYFEEASASFEFEAGEIKLPIILPAAEMPKTPLAPLAYEPELHIDLIYEALVLSIKQYFSKMGFSKAIVASSGGIDSAVTLALACEALGSENVHALLLPSQYSTGHSVSDAVQLSENLQNPYDIIEIKGIYESIETKLEPIFKDLPFGVAEENIQARTRGLLAMALANKYNYILLNTSNKTELAVGYGTLYGDMAGGIGVLGDVYKMQVYALARYINRNQEIIPENIISKAPSAELRPDQKDSDSLPPYPMLDAILYQYIEWRQGVADIVALDYQQEMVERVLNMMNRAEYKRNQFCPIIRVSPKAFGMGRRIPIVAKYEV